ncbi:MAG TPA: amino acid permease [Thermoanaerobaculia bacterium]|nr:amino acid permease [Thermoanaerobaculia bacterium]
MATPLAKPLDPVPPSPTLVRGLSTWDGTLLTIGSIVGTGVFITTADMARVLPHPGLILLVWLAGGLLTLAGALTYGELGVLFPKAGGLYHFVKEAYGPRIGFLYGWTAFLVIMSGGNAAIAVAFGEYLGSFLPWFSTGHFLLSVPIGSWTWTLSGGQVAAVLALVLLTAVNHFGLKEGAWVQNALTVLKIGAIVGLIAIGLFARAPVTPNLFGPAGHIPSGLLAAFGVAMIAALWTYDGWYGLTCSAGEMRDPGRSLPRGLILGTAAVMLMYLLLNLVYARALPISAMAETPRIAETAASVLFGPGAARLVSLVVLVSAFGCLSSTILYSSRIYLPMAEDGLFFRSLARIHPVYRTPVPSLWAQTAWSIVLTVSGTYSQLYTYVIFASVLFHAMTAAAVFIFRRRLPDAPRPYRTWGYPVVPALFILACLLLIGNTLKESPVESLVGLGIVALGVPAYEMFRRRGVVGRS